MDIACPNCGATYRVPDALIDGVSALRCVACGHAWVPDPPRAILPPVPVEAPAPPPIREPLPSPEVAPPIVEASQPAENPSVAPPFLDPPLPELPLPELPLPELPAAELPPPPVSPAPQPIRPDTTLSLTPTRAAPPGLARRRRREVMRRHRPPSALRVAWALSIAIVITFLLGLVLYSEEIAEAWPSFARLAG